MLFTVLLVCCGLAGLVGIVAEFLDTSGERRAIMVGLISAVVAFVLEILALYIFKPTFLYITDAGYVFTAIVILIAAGVGTGLVSLGKGYRNDGYPVYAVVAMFFIVMIIGGAIHVFTPPLKLDFMDNKGWDDVAHLLSPRAPTPEELVEAASDDDLLKIHAGQAYVEAAGILPEDVDTVANPGTPYEQTVNGQQVFVTGLDVANWRAFRQQGESLSGYIVRPAAIIDAESYFVAGFRMVYVPSARFSRDLAWHVYANYVVGCECRVDHLDVLEIDDEGKPWYTASVLRMAVGNVGQVVRAVITVNPETGEIIEYSLDEVPEWIDRVYSMDYVTDLVGYWAKYNAWDSNLIPTTTGKFRIDAAEDVYGHDGRLYYMFTLTSAITSAETIRYEIRIDPRTGDAVIFESQGKTLEAVRLIIRDRTFDGINPSTGANPVECERQELLGELTWYCLLEDQSESDRKVVVGYAFLQDRHSSDPSKVVLARSFSEAWDLFRRQVLTEGPTNASVQAQSAEYFLAEGKILRIGASDESVWLLVATDEHPYGLYFRVSANHPIVALSKVGDSVQIAAFDVKVDQVNDVVEIINLNLPPATIVP